jgi:methyl-accepting chemotaxis protein
MHKLSIAAAANLLGAALIGGFFAVVGTSQWALSQLKVGGPLYDRVVLVKDLVADILPPPEYIIEAYLEVNIAAREPEQAALHRERLAKLRKDYDERHAYWLGQDLSPALKDRLVVAADKPAAAFWTEVDAAFLPALAHSDHPAVEASLTRLSTLYAHHRAEIDAVVEGADLLTKDTEAYAAARDATFMSVMWTVSAVVLVLALLGIGGVILGIVRPMRAMTATMTGLAAGNAALEVPSLARGDEIGAMARSVRVFKDAMVESERLRRTQEEERKRSEQDKVAALKGMAETVENEARAAVHTVASLSARMNDNAAAMARSAANVGADSQNVAAAAAQALANAQTVATAAEQLAASIREIGGHMGASTEVTGKAVRASSEAQATIGQLSSAVDRIGEVANLISDIAAQTNLLALNATIEAARAGDAGKGFAVVAGEVKNLAAQTAKATDEISTQIAEIQATTSLAVHAVGQIDEAIADVKAVSTSVATAIEEQGAATDEIARNVLQTTEAAQEVARRIAVVSSEAQATGSRAEQVGGLSSEVSDGVATLREVLVRVVRTATVEVNRRHYPRFRIDRAGTVTVDGQPRPVTIGDISEGGLMVTGLPDGIKHGAHVEVTIPGVPGSLTAVVLVCEHHRVHGRFELAPADRDHWKATCTRLVDGLEPMRERA